MTIIKDQEISKILMRIKVKMITPHHTAHPNLLILLAFILFRFIRINWISQLIKEIIIILDNSYKLCTWSVTKKEWTSISSFI